MEGSGRGLFHEQRKKHGESDHRAVAVNEKVSANRRTNAKLGHCARCILTAERLPAEPSPRRVASAFFQPSDCDGFPEKERQDLRSA